MNVFKLSLILIVVIFAMSFKKSDPKTITIAAASDLKFALDSVVANFKKANPGTEVKVVYGIQIISFLFFSTP